MENAITTILRWSPVAVGIWYYLAPSLLDYAVACTWQYLYSGTLVHMRMTEALLATICFGSFFLLYAYLDTLPSMTRHRSHQKPAKDHFYGAHLPRHRPILTTAAALYLAGVYAFTLLITPQPLTAEPPTFARLASEVIFGIFAYDFVFFFIHVWYHASRSNWHRRHHSEAEISAKSTVEHSFIDGLLQVATNIIVQQRGPFGGRKHRLSRLLHNIIITYMLTEIHAGYDGFWCMHRVYPRILGGAERHERHHKHGNKYFQQFFCWMDDTLAYLNIDVTTMKPSNLPSPTAFMSAFALLFYATVMNR